MTASRRTPHPNRSAQPLNCIELFDMPVSLEAGETNRAPAFAVGAWPEKGLLMRLEQGWAPSPILWGYSFRALVRNCSAASAGISRPTCSMPAVGTPMNTPASLKAAPPLLPSLMSASVLM